LTKETGLRIPGTVWALGFVSMFMDISSEMIHSLLPVFLVSSLGASPAMFGFIEGIAEATASVSKVFSGALSDWLGKRKLLTLIGYGLAAITKPVFPFASTPMEVLAARFADRVGKGIRGAPRDALIADVTPESMRGEAYGLRQSLDTIGAFVGPLLAIALMYLLAGDVRGVFAWAVLPAVIAVGVLFFMVREPPDTGVRKTVRPVLRGKDFASFGPSFWSVVVVGAVFALARFSEGFLLLRAQDVGLSIGLVPLSLVTMNVVYAAVSAPAGKWSDREDPRVVLSVGLVVLVIADVVLALFDSIGGAMAGAAIWGLHMGLTQGVLSALVSRTAPGDLRGTAFGVYNLVNGVALLLASVIAGVLWSGYGAGLTFMVGGALAVLALASLTVLIRD
jgi:MFS family permease